MHKSNAGPYKILLRYFRAIYKNQRSHGYFAFSLTFFFKILKVLLKCETAKMQFRKSALKEIARLFCIILQLLMQVFKIHLFR